MKRILIIVEKIAPLGIGNGKEHINSKLIKTHVDLGFEVNVIVTKQNREDIEDSIQELGAKLIAQSNQYKKYVLPWRLKISTLLLRYNNENEEGIRWLNDAVNDTVKNGNFDLVITTLLGSDLPAWIAASLKVLNVAEAVINWEHRSHYAEISNSNRSNFVYLNRRWLFSYSDIVAVVSQPTADLMQKELGEFGSLVLRIPNPIKEDFFAIAKKRSKEPIRQDGYCIATQNFTRPLKGIDVLLKAIQNISSKRTDIKFLLVGKQQKNIYEKLNKLNINHIVTIKDRVPHNEVPILLENAHISIISSYTETFSIPAAEALASGIPVVATICGGPEDFVRNNEEGKLIPVGDSHALAEAIIEVWDSRKKYDSDKLSEYANQLFGSNTWANYWKECHSIIL